MSYIGNKKIEQVFVGGDEVTKIFVGNNLVYQKQVVPTGEYFLTFSSPNSFTLSVNNNTKHWDGTLETSTDKTNWTTWGGTSAVSSASDGTKHNIYVRGISNTIITGTSGSSSNYPWRLNGTNITIKGNIENLLDYPTVQMGNHPAMGSGAFKTLFAYPTSQLNSNIVDISELELGSLVLSSDCYRSMFQANIGITQPPILSATTLADGCYRGMFHTCRGLTTAPAIIATTLTTYCCYQMFYNCIGLTTAPAIYATTLDTYCCNQMFYGCTSLNTLPALQATTLESYCYGGMFNGCTSVGIWNYSSAEHSVPYRIPASGTGVMASNALNGMFRDAMGNVGDPSINTTYYTSNQAIYPDNYVEQDNGGAFSDDNPEAENWD